MPTPGQKLLNYLRSDPVLLQYNEIFARMSLDDAANVASGVFPGTTRIRRENGETLIESEPGIEFLASNSDLLFMTAGLVAKGYRPRIVVRLGQVPGRVYDDDSKLDDYALHGLMLTCETGVMRIDVQELDLREGLDGLQIEQAMLQDDLVTRLYKA